MHACHIIEGFPFILPLLIGLYNCLMVKVFRPTTACPCAYETLALRTISFLAFFGVAIMLFKRMFTQTFKVIRTVRGDMFKAFAFAF